VRSARSVMSRCEHSAPAPTGPTARIDELAAWILDQIAADEASLHEDGTDDGAHDGAACSEDDVWLSAEWTDHRERPSRLEAELASKRSVVDAVRDGGGDREDDTASGADRRSRRTFTLLCLLAAQYADRIGYRDDWATPPTR